MSAKVTVKPKFISGNGYPMTDLEITVDCTDISVFLKKYNVIILTTLVVATPTEEGTIKQQTYDFSQCFKNIRGNTIVFKVLVQGYIEDEGQIDCRTRGILVRKD